MGPPITIPVTPPATPTDAATARRRFFNFRMSGRGIELVSLLGFDIDAVVIVGILLLKGRGGGAEKVEVVVVVVEGGILDEYGEDTAVAVAVGNPVGLLVV